MCSRSTAARRRFGEAVQVATGRTFVVIITVVAYLIALRLPQSIFDVATQYAFAGYSALTPLLVGALFWRKSTRWGALASALWVAAAVLGVAAIQQTIPPPAPGLAVPVWSVVRRRDHHARGRRDDGAGDAAGRADDADLGGADGRRLADDAVGAAIGADPGPLFRDRW